MAPAPSHWVPRAPWYSGTRLHAPWLRVRGFHPLWPAFPVPFRSPGAPILRAHTPARTRAGLGSSRSARRYSGNHFCFLLLRLLRCFSSPGAPHAHYGFMCGYVRSALRGFPHSDTCGSTGICPSPQLFAACRVFHRPAVPRHPPCALPCLTICARLAWRAGPFLALFSLRFSSLCGRSASAVPLHRFRPCPAFLFLLFSLGLMSLVLGFLCFRYSVFKVRINYFILAV